MLENEENEETSSPYQYSIKYIIVGDSSVGKSNLLLRYSKNIFDPGHTATLGIEFANKKLVYNNINYVIQIWDTAGQENFRSVTRAYYKASACAMIVYDISNRKTFQNIENWIKDCVNLAPKTVLLVLIGNKTDLEEKREVSFDEGENLAKLNNMLFYETSALNGTNVNTVFNKTIEMIDEKIRKGFYDMDDSSNQGIRRITKSGIDVSGEHIINKNQLNKRKNNSDDFFVDCCK